MEEVAIFFKNSKLSLVYEVSNFDLIVSAVTFPTLTAISIIEDAAKEVNCMTEVEKSLICYTFNLVSSDISIFFVSLIWFSNAFPVYYIAHPIFSAPYLIPLLK